PQPIVACQPCCPPVVGCCPPAPSRATLELGCPGVVPAGPSASPIAPAVPRLDPVPDAAGGRQLPTAPITGSNYRPRPLPAPVPGQPLTPPLPPRAIPLDRV